MHIDIMLKSIIEEKNIAPTQAEKDDISSWVLNKWIPFCVECLQNETLFNSFKNILNEKITEEANFDGYYLTSNVVSSRFTKHFFIHLLVECNKEFSWIDLSRMNLDNFANFSWKKLNKLEEQDYELITNKLDQHYQLAITEWLHEKIDTVNPVDKYNYYKNALNVYCEAYLTDLFGAPKYLKKIMGQALNAYMNAEDDMLIIIQKNKDMIREPFLQFLSNNKLTSVAMLDFVLDADVIDSVLSNDLNDHFKRVFQSQFNYALKEYLLQISNEKLDKNELIINLEFVQSGVSNSHMDFMPELVEKNVYRKITVCHENKTLFSYDRKYGVRLNCNFVDISTADRVDAVNDMLDNKVFLQELHNKKRQNSYSYGFSSFVSSDISYDIQKYVNEMADKSVSKTAQVFIIDQHSIIYKSGKSAVKAYLSKLDQQYTQLLTSNAIDKGYELILASKMLTSDTPLLDIRIIKGMTSYFKDKLASSNDFIFSCQKITISLSKAQIDDEYAEELCFLIECFDRTKVAECYFNIENLEASQVQKLTDALLKVSYTTLRFNIINSFEQSCQLEAINEKQRQTAVAYYDMDNLKQLSHKNEIVSQPKPVTRLKLKALMDKVVELKPVDSQIGIQNQHQYEAEVQEKAEVEIKQSWQITEAKQVQKENVYRHDHISGDEVSSLISWSQIEAALDASHSKHDAACNQLGKEILQYNYKNRNLKDLWERLTGNIEVTEQNSNREYEAKYEWLRYYSQHIPKQISYKTLLTIVRLPHLFQDGLNLYSMPESFGYDAQNGALYTRHGKEITKSIEDKPNPYVVKISAIESGDLPGAEHINALMSSDIPSRMFYQSLASLVTPYQAWHAWKQAFHSLNLFNIEGIETLNEIVQKALYETKQDNQIMLNYLMFAMNYYCYVAETEKSASLKPDKMQFEDELKQKYNKGEMYSLSSEQINSLDVISRNAIHESLVALISNNQLKIKSNKEDKLSYRQLLAKTISYHQNKLPEVDKNKFEKLQKEVFEIFDTLSVVNLIKIMELSLSQDKSAIYSFSLMLYKIHRVYGEKGLQDFNDCFLSPAINLATLVNLQGQQAVTTLLQLSPVEYHWWEQLTIQHVENSGYCDFVLAMNVFQHFLSELQELGVRDLLSLPCPLQGITNIQVGLERVSQVLKKVKNPAEQMRNLSGLDWSASGVVYALPNVNYNFITQDMKLDALEDNALRKTLKRNESYFHDKSYHHYSVSSSDLWMNDKIKYDAEYFHAIHTCFYRYIGCNKFVAPLQVYKQLLDAIKLPDDYAVIYRVMGTIRINDTVSANITHVGDVQNFVLTNLLKVIAYSTTGQRALDALPDTEKERAFMVNDFIKIVYDCSIYKYRDDQVQAQLDAIHAVSEHDIREILYLCAALSKEKDEYTKDESFRLTMKELTALLRMVKLSINAHDKLTQDKCSLMTKSSPEDKELAFENIATIYTQLSRTKELLSQYGYYLTEAFQRINKYNTGMDYASFVAAGAYIKTINLSFENKARLLRIISLIPFNRLIFYAESHRVIDMLKLIVDSQDKIDKGLLDGFLSLLSSIIPNKQNACFTIDGLIELVNLFVSKAQQHQIIDIKTFVLSQYKNFKIDSDVTEIKDVDFYQDQYQLEQKYPHLGVYYHQIKTIIFNRYPVRFGENKQQAWDNFIGIIQRLENKQKQNQILQMLLNASQQIDLTTLNMWLRSLLSHEKDRFRAKFKPEYFDALHVSLLTHENKNEFIKVLNDWFNYTDWFSTQDHLGFIKILNALADNNNERINLGSIYDIARNIAAISTRDQFPWYDKMSLLIALIKDKHKDVNIEDIFSSLSKFFKKNEHDHCYSESFKILIRLWLSNIENAIDFTLNLPKRWDSDNTAKSYAQLFVLAHLTQFDQNKAWEFLIQLGDDELKKLMEVYESQPAPSAQLFAKLVNSELDVSTFCIQYISDPHHERTEDKLNQQFDNDILWPYINRAKYIDQDTSFPLHFSSEFADQLKFMNHLGRSEFRFLSSKEIGLRLYECRTMLASADNTVKQLTVYLTAFALAREVVYKTSRAPAILWPTPIQMLAVLSAINHQLKSGVIDPLFMQMATGEGKSLLGVFFSILTWLNGNPVALVTHRASLALRDAKTYESLFKSINIESEHLTAEGYRSRHFWRQWSKEKRAEFDGIYYVEFNDIALIKQQRLLDEGQDIDNMSFIIDEADEIILHNQLDNNLSQAIGDAETHQHAWVFLAIAAYIDKNIYKNSSLNIRIADLISYVCEEFPLAANVSQDPEFLAMLPSYINASWHARTLIEKVDFIPKKHEKRDEYYAAVIINDKAMPSNVTFNGLIHQALHGRLNYEAKLKNSFRLFHVAPETRLFSSMSPEAVLQWMVQCKRLIALSATRGSNPECMEMQQHYGFQFIKLPKMQHSLRHDYPKQICRNQVEQMRAIADICQAYIDKRTPAHARSLLIVVDTIDKADKLHAYLLKTNSHYNINMLHAGIDTITDATLGEIEKQAGQMGQILIATSGPISRGFDIKLSTAKQLVGVTTYLKSEEDEIQVKGRVSRVNQITGLRDKGKFYAVYDLEAELARYPENRYVTDDVFKNPEAFKQKHYFSYYKKESFNRLYKQLMSTTKNTIQMHFYSLWASYFKGELIPKPLRSKIMGLFTESLETMSNAIPLSDFNTASHQGLISRRLYNNNLLTIYHELMTKLISIADAAIPSDSEGIIPNLLSKIESGQAELIRQHERVLQAGIEQPINLHSKWKQEQNMSAYVVNMFSGFMRSNNNIESNDMLVKKQAKGSDFIEQLQFIMKMNQSEQNLFALCLAHYEEMLERDKHQNRIPVFKNLVMREILCIQHQFGDGQNMILVHEPLIDMGCQIHITANSSDVFRKLQVIIHNIYKTLAINQPLQFRISKEATQYKVVINFSGHQFDSVDKKKLFSLIGEVFSFATDPLFDGNHYPSLKVMKHIVNEIRLMLIRDLGSIPEQVSSYFKLDQTLNSRKGYHSYIFDLLFKRIGNFNDVISVPLQNAVKALLRYNHVIKYQNQKGIPCIADAPSFSNLSELLEIDKKRQAMSIINDKVAEFDKSTMKDALLCKFQKDCLVQLGCDIACSKGNQTLFDIYERWQHKKIEYMQESMTSIDLMRLSKTETSYLFNATSSPKVYSLCEEIDRLRRDEVSQDINKVMNFST